MLKLLYTLSVKDEDTDETIGSISAYSEDALIEQLHKIETAIEDYKAEWEQIKDEKIKDNFKEPIL